MAYGSIDEIYQQLLGRAPDAGGQQFYGGLLSGGTSLDEIARQIGASDEAGSYRNSQQMAQLQQDMYNQGYVQPANGMGPMIPRELAQQGITQWSQYQPAAGETAYGGGGGAGNAMPQPQMQMQPWMEQYQQYQQQWANQMNQFSSQLGGLLGNLSAPAGTTGANSSLVPASGTQSAPAASWKTGLLGTLANTANPWSY